MKDLGKGIATLAAFAPACVLALQGGDVASWTPMACIIGVVGVFLIWGGGS